MRYEGTRPSNIDKDKDVYVLALGIEELKVMHQVISDVLERTPRIFETSVFRNRLINMNKRVIEALNNRDRKDG